MMDDELDPTTGFPVEDDTEEEDEDEEDLDEEEALDEDEEAPTEI